MALEGIDREPGYYTTYFEVLQSLLPWWGGSYREMDLWRVIPMKFASGGRLSSILRPIPGPISTPLRTATGLLIHPENLDARCGNIGLHIRRTGTSC